MMMLTIGLITVNFLSQNLQNLQNPFADLGKQPTGLLSGGDTVV
jgi:hypothetical protein